VKDTQELSNIAIRHIAQHKKSDFIQILPVVTGETIKAAELQVNHRLPCL
jgi:hypothetical protein